MGLWGCGVVCGGGGVVVIYTYFYVVYCASWALYLGLLHCMGSVGVRTLALKLGLV